MSMSRWIPYPTTLAGDTVALVAIDQSHYNALKSIAADKRIWQFYAYDNSDSEKFNLNFEKALAALESGDQFPFTIIHKSDQRIIGSTRFMDIQPAHRKLEIGTTWLAPEYWGTAVNLECKLLLLTYCFETLKTFRVQFKTDETNIRSRKAIQKIGGVFEGILRNDIVRDNGTHRHSAYYSIIDSEWTEKKSFLSNLLQEKLSKKI
jgi:RimJ/RimL family protein N-acetyltransferase